MKIFLVNNKGQAAAELAILGVLILMAFSFVMNFGQSLGTVQQTKMNSFRKALRRAYDKNGTVAYTLRNNANLASVNSGFFQGQDSTVEGSYSVTWAKGASGPQGTSDEGMYGYWQINKMPPIELPTKAQYHYGPTGQKSDEKIKTPYSVYRVDEARMGNYAYNLTKEESNSGIDYSKQATLVDSTAGLLYTRINTNVDKNPGDDNTPTPRYSRGVPSPFIDSQLYRYDEDWSVPHDL
jgi:uncharacterized protein (UPF0333 family)